MSHQCIRFRRHSMQSIPPSLISIGISSSPFPRSRLDCSPWSLAFDVVLLLWRSFLPVLIQLSLNRDRSLYFIPVSNFHCYSRSFFFPSRSRDFSAQMAANVIIPTYLQSPLFSIFSSFLITIVFGMNGDRIKMNRLIRSIHVYNEVGVLNKYLNIMNMIGKRRISPSNWKPDIFVKLHTYLRHISILSNERPNCNTKSFLAVGSVSMNNWWPRFVLHFVSPHLEPFHGVSWLSVWH